MPYHLSPTQPHLLYGDRWIVANDTPGVLAGERQRYNAPGTHLIGYVYVDHQAGLTLDVALFCERLEDGTIQPGGGPREDRSRLIMRYEGFHRFDLEELPPEHVQALGLPSEPEWLDVYRRDDLRSLRELELLHPLRAPGFPDDIRFFLVARSDEHQHEMVWGRLEGQIQEGYFVCTLLNQPRRDFGIKAGNRVSVSVNRTPDGVVPICVGRLEPKK